MDEKTCKGCVDGSLKMYFINGFAAVSFTQTIPQLL